MKFLPLIWSGLWRKPGRTFLTLMQVMVAFALFGVLQGMKSGVDQAVANARGDVLFVSPATFGGDPLRRADIERLKAIPDESDIRDRIQVLQGGDFIRPRRM